MEYLSDCVGWPRRHVRELCDMVDRARDISVSTFRRRIGAENYRDLEDGLGYGPRCGGLRLKTDYHVSFCRSSLYGTPVYFCKHSGIEHVYAPPGFDLDHAQARVA